MLIRTVSEMSDLLGVHFVGENGKAILIEGSPLCIAKTESGVLVIEGDIESTREILMELGVESQDIFT